MGRRKTGAQSDRATAPQGYSATSEPDGDRSGFKFDFHCKWTRISDAAMLDGLRTRHAQLGRLFTTHEFNAWPDRPCSADLYRARFGSWRRAMDAAGIEGARGRDFTPAELIDNLENAWRKRGRRPSNSTFRLYSTIGIGPYQRVWGTLRRACELFARHKAGLLSRRLLLNPGQPGRPRRRGVPPGLRWKVLEAAGHRCCACGRSSNEKGVRLEVDHIIPVAKGGSDEMDNLRALCRDCNRGRGVGRLKAKGEERKAESAKAGR